MDMLTLLGVQIKFDQSIDSTLLLPLLQNFQPFTNWVQKFCSDCKLTKLLFQSYDLFGSRIGFMKIQVQFQIDTHIQSSVVFLKGDAVGILPIINNTYILLTKQFRAPLGRLFLEIPGGMTDGSLDFSLVALKELQEETGLHISKKSLKSLGKIIPSPDLCDEYIHLFLLEIEMSETEMKIIKEKLFGTDDEAIKIKILKVEDAFLEVEDASTLVAMSKAGLK
ncbi:ADP-sugar_diphosphatase [Hexamita inflata]|uniref:ADP-sugar diphosphatase n=1 Tax=Hexamita inflata TaxID=28002 RepID=A0AA86RGU6_9EUKA|nr:ADP-sugar diphosphatase [Hexamita inflata]